MHEEIEELDPNMLNFARALVKPKIYSLLKVASRQPLILTSNYLSEMILLEELGLIKSEHYVVTITDKGACFVGARDAHESRLRREEWP